MKRNITKYAGILLLIGAGLIYLYVSPLINKAINEGIFSKANFDLGINEVSFYVNYGYVWFIPLMVILGIFYLSKKENQSVRTGALIHTFFAVAIALYALMMSVFPNDEIYELIIIVNSWLLIIAGIVALLFRAFQTTDPMLVPQFATKSLLIALPIIAVLLFPIDFGSEGGLLKIGQFLLSLVLIVPFHLFMKWIWKMFI